MNIHLGDARVWFIAEIEPQRVSSGLQKFMSLTYFHRFLKSVGFALQGIRTFYTTQYNAKIHLGFSVAVTLAGMLLQISATDWCLLILAMGMVWSAEAANTALEFLTDLASPEYHPLAKKAKDVAAGAVLLASFAAALVGLLVFVPAVRAYFGW